MGWYQRLVDKVGGILFYTTVGLMVLFSAPLYFVLYVWLDAPSAVVHSSIPSPDGRLSAIIYEVEGDATTSFNTQISIAPTNRSFSRDRNPPFLALHGQHDLAVKWLSNKLIQIDLPEDETIYRNDPSVGDITVEYK